MDEPIFFCELEQCEVAFARKTLQQRGFSFAELPDVSGLAVNSVLVGTK